MQKYVVESTKSGVEVLVHLSEAEGDCTPLKSVYGPFEWGYRGSGPDQLAHALLADLISRKFGHDFMLEVVSEKSPINDHARAVVFTEEEILDWLKSKLFE